jgi:cobalt/nickel transport system permease protein
MHIPEGVLSGSPWGIAALATGAALTAAGTAIGLARLDYERVPRVAMLSAAFFVASLITVPVGGGTYIHPVLNGLIGLILGWAAFPALLVALFLQAVFFQYGGLTTLGVNTFNMAAPAVVCYYLYHRACMSDRTAFAGGLAAGATGILLAALLLAACLFSAGKGFHVLSLVALVANIGVAVVEGLLTGSVVLFLRKVKPELLQSPHAGETGEFSHA